MYVGDVCWSLLFKPSDGSGDVKTESLTVTENGTYTAPSGVAYTQVIVNVGEPDDSSVVGTAIVGKAIVGSEDSGDVVGTAIVGKSTTG